MNTHAITGTIMACPRKHYGEDESQEFLPLQWMVRDIEELTAAKDEAGLRSAMLAVYLTPPDTDPEWETTPCPECYAKLSRVLL